MVVTMVLATGVCCVGWGPAESHEFIKLWNML